MTLKPVLQPDEASQRAVRQIIYAHLMECTDRGSKALGCTGASFVTSGIGMRASELAELDATATAHLLHALGNLFDPKNGPTQKQYAEKQRAKAVKRLLAAVDLDMTPPAGQA